MSDIHDSKHWGRTAYSQSCVDLKELFAWILYFHLEHTSKIDFLFNFIYPYKNLPENYLIIK